MRRRRLVDYLPEFKFGDNAGTELNRIFLTIGMLPRPTLGLAPYPTYFELGLCVVLNTNGGILTTALNEHLCSNC